MAYQSQTFPNRTLLALVRKTLISITHLDVDSQGRPQIFAGGGNEDLPDYPYISFEATTPHATQQASLGPEHDLFNIVFTINCYSNLPEDVIGMADDIQLLLKDPTYRQIMTSQGVIPRSCVSSGTSLAEFANLLDVSAQSLTLTLSIHRKYQSKYFTITDTNLGGTSNG